MKQRLGTYITWRNSPLEKIPTAEPVIESGPLVQKVTILPLSQAAELEL